VGKRACACSRWRGTCETFRNGSGLGDPVVEREHQTLQAVLPEVEPLFRRLIVRQRSCCRKKTTMEIIHAAHVAMELSPGCAEGLPLRSLAVLGTDTKFSSVTALL